MKNKMILFALAFLTIIAIANNVSADITFWRQVTLFNNESIVRLHGYYQFNDDSKSLLGKFKSIPVSIIYSWQDIPFNLTQFYPQYTNALIDYCNLTIIHDSNTYDTTQGNLNSSIEQIYNIYITNNISDSQQLNFELKHQDSLILDFDCHYTNSQTLYIDNILFGDWDTYFPAFSCKGCEETKLEELSNEISYNEQQAIKEVSMYSKMQTIVKLNYNLWSIGSWIIKILLVFVALYLVFLLGYLFYSLIYSMAGRR